MRPTGSRRARMRAGAIGDRASATMATSGRADRTGRMDVLSPGKGSRVDSWVHDVEGR